MQCVDRGTAAGSVNLPVPTAGKTGTTNDARDVWFVGFTSSIAAGCYIGYDQPQPLGRGASGGGMCGPVFNEFMQEAIREYGGGAFVLVYLLCIALIGLPVMMVEILLGRRGRQSPINTMKTLAKEEGTTRAWSWIGWSGVISGFLILSFYSVIAGWALAYVIEAASGTFNGISAEQRRVTLDRGGGRRRQGDRRHRLPPGFRP